MEPRVWIDPVVAVVVAVFGPRNQTTEILTTTIELIHLALHLLMIPLTIFEFDWVKVIAVWGPMQPLPYNKMPIEFT